MKPPAGRFAMFGLVACALGALGGVAALSRPVSLEAGRPAASPRTAAVSVSLRGCPAPGAANGTAGGVALLAAAARPGAGAASVSPLATAGTTPAPALRVLSRPGALAVVGVPPASSPAPAASTRGHRRKTAAPASRPAAVMIQARGAMAQGLEAEQTSAGVATASCASPGTDFWFAMPGQQAAGVIQLVLMNTDSQASEVDVDLFTDAGPVQTGADTGISVPAHGVITQSLATLVHGSRAVAVHVRTSVGRVVAAVREDTQPGQPGQWLPPAQPPARHLVIPGLPASPGQREFYIADPGATDATARLTVVTPGGAYSPAGAGVIDIPAGSATSVDLPSLTGVAGAAVLTANVPVIASVVIPGGQRGAPGALTAAAPLLAEQGVVADAGQGSDVTTVVLSAPGRAARVSVRAGVSGLTSGGPGPARIVSVPARRSVTVKVARPAGVAAGSPFAIVLTPLRRSGPVYAGRVLTAPGGSVLGIMPVASALTRVPLPSVRDSLSAVVP